MDNMIVLDYENMLEYIKDDMEYLFVDRVEVIPGKSAEGIKLASSQDWYFKIHFPGNPMMPGVFIMESIMQTGGYIINTMPGKKDFALVFRGCKSLDFYKDVRPGDILRTHATLESYKRGVAKFFGEAFVDDVKVCSMKFTLVVLEEIPKILPKESEI